MGIKVEMFLMNRNMPVMLVASDLLENFGCLTKDLYLKSFNFLSKN